MLTTSPANHILASSFRDPNGYVFERDATIYRKVCHSYRETYRLLHTTGLYDRLVADGKLIDHQETAENLGFEESSIILQPTRIPFISYPYEWSYSQLKDAALLTLSIAQTALAHGMVLKDASAYNIQFFQGRPVFIDTLSFEPYIEGQPWAAYAQFCRHFLAPLWLAVHTDVRCILMLRDFIDGIPLDYATSILRHHYRLSMTELVHLRMHSSFQQRTPANKGERNKGQRMSRIAHLGLLDNLQSAISKLTWKSSPTEWSEYYTNTNYSNAARANKHKLVASIINEIRPKQVLDVGSNDGTFSHIAAKYSELVVSLDIDPIAVEAHYKQLKASGKQNTLPLLMDLRNPSMGIGWMCEERSSLFERAQSDFVMALAFVHHMCIANNVPFRRLVDFFDRLTKKYLLVEFVPKCDSQVQRLLSTRDDVFPNYNLSHFADALANVYVVEKILPIVDSARTLLLCRKRS